MADDWITPDSHVDPESTWNDEPYAYDDDPGWGYYAWCSVALKSWSNYLELHLDTPILCDKVRYSSEYGPFAISKISLDVFYEAGWHNIYEGAFLDKSWDEKSIPAGTKTVSAMRAKFWNNSDSSTRWPEWLEADFNQVPAPVVSKKWWFNLSDRPDREVVAVL